MTLLVLLVSIAALEWVLHHGEPTAKRGQLPENKELNLTPPEQSPASLADSLNALGKAVDQFGHGTQPEPAPPATGALKPAPVRKL
jgi:hypothetical protein